MSEMEEADEETPITPNPEAADHSEQETNEDQEEQTPDEDKKIVETEPESEEAAQPSIPEAGPDNKDESRVHITESTPQPKTKSSINVFKRSNSVAVMKRTSSKSRTALVAASAISLGNKPLSKSFAKKSEILSSKGKLALGSVISIRRASAAEEYYDRGKAAKYMNTYKLDSDKPFNPEEVRKILQSVMIEALDNLTYDPDKCPKQAKWASGVIRDKIKELEFDRYKLICLVTIGEKNLQDVYVTCRFLWDVDRDRYAIFTHENIHVFGIAQCFGLYYE